MQDSFKKLFITSTFYVAIAKYSGVLIQLAITAILARLLEPKDFGLIALITVLVLFFNILGELGIGPAIIQNKSLTGTEINSIFTFTIYLGLILSSVFFLLSPCIGGFYELDQLVTISKYFSINVFFSCANIVPNALLLRNMRFKFQMYRQLSIQFTCGVLGVATALLNWGVYSLLVFSITSVVLTFIVNYCYHPLQLTFIKIESLRVIAKYSFYQFLYSIINFFSRNLDNILIGKYLNIDLLGYYEKSYQLMLMPIQNLTGVLAPVIHPAFSKFQNDTNKIYNSFLEMAKVLSFFGFPLAAFLHFSSHEIITIVYGDKWLPAIPVFKILAISVAPQLVYSISGALFLAANNTKQLFFSGVLVSIIMIGAICIGIFKFNTLVPLAYLLLLAFIINFFQTYYILIRFTLKESYYNFLKILIKPFFLGLIVALLEFSLNFFVISNIYFSLLLKSSILLLAYTYVFFILKYKILPLKPRKDI